MSQYPKLDDYINQARAVGKTDDQIKQEMLGAGYNQEDVKNVFFGSEVLAQQNSAQQNNLSNQTTPTYSSQENNNQKSKKIIAVMVVAVLFLSSVAGVYAWYTGMFSDAPYSESNFLTGLVQKIATIKTANYSVSASFVGMTREEGATPFYSDSSNMYTFYDQFNEFAEMIPPEIDVEASFSAKSSLTQDNNADFETNIAVSGDLGDITYKIDVDLLKKDKDLFVKINNFPSIFLFMMPPKGQWIRISEDMVYLNRLGDFGIPVDAEYVSDNNKIKEDYKDFMVDFLKIADENKLFKFAQRPEKTELNGQTVYKYDLKINVDSIVSFFDDTLRLLRSGKHEFISSADVEDIEENITAIELEQIKKIINYYNKNTKNILWVDANGNPLKIESTNRLVPDSDKLSDLQFVLKVSLDLNDINQPVDINVPDSYVDLEEIMAGNNSFGLSSARDKGMDASIKANLSIIRAQAEIFSDETGAFGLVPFALGPCSDKAGTIFAEPDIYGSILSATEDEIKSATCVSSATAGKVDSWAISVPLASDPKTSFCVDSVGNAIEIKGSLKGKACK